MEYILLSEKDWDEVEPLLINCFLTREPTCVALHIKSEEVSAMMGMVAVEFCLKSGCSYGARDTETGKLVGFMLNRIGLLEHREEEKNFKYDGTPQEMLKIQVLKHVYKEYDVYDKFGVDRIFEFVMLTVDPSYKGKGIARKLVEVSEQKAIEEGCPLGKVEASNVITQHIWKQLDYKTFLTFDFAEYNKEKGEKVFDVEAVAPTKGWECMAKRLNGNGN